MLTSARDLHRLVEVTKGDSLRVRVYAWRNARDACAHMNKERVRNLVIRPYFVVLVFVCCHDHIRAWVAFRWGWGK